MTAVAIELRKLDAVATSATSSGSSASAYPTPWSRTMFAGELAKPTSICLGAFDRATDELVGYLIISRYVDAWHVMNVAVDARLPPPRDRARAARDGSSS